jgi:hypothetical protein
VLATTMVLFTHVPVLQNNLYHDSIVTEQNAVPYIALKRRQQVQFQEVTKKL